MLGLLVLADSFGDLTHERDYFKRPQNPRVIQSVIDMQISMLVLFVHSDSNLSKEIERKMQPIAQKLRGVNPAVLIDCSRNNSIAYCEKNKIKRYPTLMMFNQDFKFAKPRKYDGDYDETFTEEDVMQWIFENKRSIMDFSLRVDALIPVLEAPPRAMVVYFAKGPTPPLFMQRFCLMFHQDLRHVLQPGFDQKNWEGLDGLEIQKYLKPNQDQMVLVTADGRIYPATGVNSYDQAMLWIRKLIEKGALTK